MSDTNSKIVTKHSISYVLVSVVGVLFATAICWYVHQHYGLEAMLVLFVAISGAMWGWVIRWLYRSGGLTLSHILVIWMVWTGTIMGGASYYLAYKDLVANLETLSRYIMVEVVAGVGGYFIKSGIENAIKISGSMKNKNNSIQMEKESDDELVDL